MTFLWGCGGMVAGWCLAGLVLLTCSATLGTPGNSTVAGLLALSTMVAGFILGGVLGFRYGRRRPPGQE
jgi:hypothetical protein